MDPIVITTEEVAHTKIPVQGGHEVRPKVPNPVPLWARILVAPLVIVLPLLSLAALILRLCMRNQPPKVRQTWASYLLTLLIVSGLLSTAGVIFTFSSNTVPVPDAISSSLSNLDERSNFPALPTGQVMSSVQLSSTLKPLVLLASPTAKRWFQSSSGPSGMLGAALILHADSHGYLLATARHVADGEGWQSRSGPQRVMVSDGMNGWASAEVVGRHKQLDVALLWLNRHEGSSEFTQPVATYSSVQMGEKIFVIGHPEGLNFSVSNGIVSRTPGNDVLQVSAPISPGNSGGPVYDEYGNLLGIVTSKVARSMEPEAENLNFAVSTEALLHEADWNMVIGGGAPANLLASFVHQTKVRKALTETASAQ
ncbi:MAG TPA: serine protease [Candidatus Angelobacter sp.]|nr:serine protease [Candidatus Angelobacter sp.]